jgi:hypothetical protein
MVFELKKRAATGPAPSGVPLDLATDPWPALAEMLFATTWPDGSARVPSSLTVFTGDGVVKACLNDKDADLTAWASAGSLAALLDTLEVGLQSDGLDWRKGGKRVQRKR